MKVPAIALLVHTSINARREAVATATACPSGGNGDFHRNSPMVDQNAKNDAPGGSRSDFFEGVNQTLHPKSTHSTFTGVCPLRSRTCLLPCGRAVSHRRQVRRAVSHALAAADCSRPQHHDHEELICTAATLAEYRRPRQHHGQCQAPETGMYPVERNLTGAVESRSGSGISTISTTIGVFIFISEHT